MVPSIHLKAKVLFKIIHDLPDKAAAVKEDWGVIQLVSWLVVALGVWHTEILFCRGNEFLSKGLFKRGILAVLGCALLVQELTELHLFLLLLAEPFKVLLQRLIVLKTLVPNNYEAVFF